MNTATAAYFADECRDKIPTIVRSHPESAKIIAFKVGKTPRAIENIEQRLSLPSLPTAIAMAQYIEPLRKQLLEWLQADYELDPELDRKTIRLALAIQDHLGKS